MIKFISILSILSCFSINNAVCGDFKPINKEYRARIIQAIFKLEGGNKTPYPFGVRSIDTKGNKELARQICARTISNHYIRWQQYGKTNSFLISLADRYCPAKTDKIGNKNWRKNIVAMVKE